MILRENKGGNIWPANTITFGAAKEKPEVAGTFPETRASAQPAWLASHGIVGPIGKNRPKIRAFHSIGVLSLGFAMNGKSYRFMII